MFNVLHQSYVGQLVPSIFAHGCFENISKNINPKNLNQRLNQLSPSVQVHCARANVVF